MKTISDRNKKKHIVTFYNNKFEYITEFKTYIVKSLSKFIEFVRNREETVNAFKKGAYYFRIILYTSKCTKNITGYVPIFERNMFTKIKYPTGGTDTIETKQYETGTYFIINGDPSKQGCSKYSEREFNIKARKSAIAEGCEVIDGTYIPYRGKVNINGCIIPSTGD